MVKGWQGLAGGLGSSPNGDKNLLIKRKKKEIYATYKQDP